MENKKYVIGEPGVVKLYSIFLSRDITFVVIKADCDSNTEVIKVEIDLKEHPTPFMNCK